MKRSLGLATMIAATCLSAAAPEETIEQIVAAAATAPAEEVAQVLGALAGFRADFDHGWRDRLGDVTPRRRRNRSGDRRAVEGRRRCCLGG